MKKLLKYVACLAILLMVIVLFTGCDFLEGKVTGGGWFIDEDTQNKCTFGFVAQGKCFEYKGQFQFNDHEDTKIHTDVEGLLEFGETYAVFVGEDEEGNYVKVSVWDLGQPGADPGDYIKIWYNEIGGSPNWQGELGGGNLKVHKEK